MDRIVHFQSLEEAGFELPPGVEEYGSYNYMPKPCEQASEHEYIHSTAHYTPRFTEYRQVKDLPGFPFSTVRIYWYSGRGWAIRFPGKWHSRRPDEGEGYSMVWEEPLSYFRIGCEHLMKVAERRGGHEERLLCEKCGYSYWIDTS